MALQNTQAHWEEERQLARKLQARCSKYWTRMGLAQDEMRIEGFWLLKERKIIAVIN